MGNCPRGKSPEDNGPVGDSHRMQLFGRNCLGVGGMSGNHNKDFLRGVF